MKFRQGARRSSTRTKVLESAFRLFGRYGFEGTSVRDIASASNVNIAAVNYHFGSKENLFWQVMLQTFLELDQSIQKMHGECHSVEELSGKLFDYFVEEKTALKNTMKMLLTESVKPPRDKNILQVIDSPFGPPGGQYFQELIQKECRYKLSPMGMMWAVKSIFGSIMHWSVMLGSEKICQAGQKDQLMSPEQIKKDVLWMVEATMAHLKKNRREFKSPQP